MESSSLLETDAPEPSDRLDIRERKKRSISNDASRFLA